MIIDNAPIEEYPFDGAFYKYKVDGSKPLDEQVEEEILVLSCKCDIIHASQSDANGNLVSFFKIYFPFNHKKDKVEVERGMKFRGHAYGLNVNGTVFSVAPSQLDGVECYVEDSDV